MMSTCFFFLLFILARRIQNCFVTMKRRMEKNNFIWLEMNKKKSFDSVKFLDVNETGARYVNPSLKFGKSFAFRFTVSIISIFVFLLIFERNLESGRKTNECREFFIKWILKRVSIYFKTQRLLLPFLRN